MLNSLPVFILAQPHNPFNAEERTFFLFFQVDFAFPF